MLKYLMAGKNRFLSLCKSILLCSAVVLVTVNVTPATTALPVTGTYCKVQASGDYQYYFTANGQTLDLNGKTLSGSFCGVRIENNGFSSCQIRNTGTSASINNCNTAIYIHGTNVSGNIVRDIVIGNSCNNGIFLDKANNSDIFNCQSTATGYGFLFSEANRTYMTDSYAYNAHNGSGLRIQACENVVIRNCEFTANYTGLMALGAPYLIVTDCNFYDNDVNGAALSSTWGATLGVTNYSDPNETIGNMLGLYLDPNSCYNTIGYTLGYNNDVYDLVNQGTGNTFPGSYFQNQW